MFWNFIFTKKQLFQVTAPISVEPMLLWKSNCFDKKFVLRWLCSEIGWVEVRWKNWMTANFHVRKMYSTIKRMDDSEYTTEIIIVPLKELKGQSSTAWWPEQLLQGFQYSYFCSGSPVEQIKFHWPPLWVVFLFVFLFLFCFVDD